MVKTNLRKVVIKNFKSLHDCEIDIGKMNVVVGANASGKSNLVEVFRLLKKIYIEKDVFPFLEWWGYDNVVWQRKEELPIIIGLLFDIEGYDVYFETNFTGVGQKFQILREVLDIRGYVKFEKEGEWITVKHNVNFIEDVIKNLSKYEASQEIKAILKMEKHQLIKGKKIRAESESRLLENEYVKVTVIRGEDEGLISEKSTGEKFYLSYIPVSRRFQKTKDLETILALCPVFKKGDRYNVPIYRIVPEIILSNLTKLLILYPLNIRLMKVPQPFRREETLKEDGSNIASVYHTIYLKEGKIPEQVYNPLSMVFPKIDVRPHLTDDGRVLIKFLEDGLELLPPNTSDGFYKILTVLIAIYLKPPLLIVDEIENSLHPETLELILDTIKASD
ncbi:MAG: AAA family ATPase, partial [Candidatus Methanoperedens sp.]|nr:AAA family ATPase [Candidatus Methanoperedens sp.]